MHTYICTGTDLLLRLGCKTRFLFVVDMYAYIHMYRNGLVAATWLPNMHVYFLFLASGGRSGRSAATWLYPYFSFLASVEGRSRWDSETKRENATKVICTKPERAEDRATSW